MSQITTHVLDTSRGLPATGIAITLFQKKDGEWHSLAKGATDSDGRISDLLSQDAILEPSEYKLLFETAAYYEALKEKTFYPAVEIIFGIEDSAHYHVPLLLSAFGYSTYRGS